MASSNIRVAGFIAILLSALPTTHGQEQECCPFKTVENSIVEKFNGAYTLVNDSRKREEACNDGCIYERDGFEYCFVIKPGELLIRPLAYVVCEDSLAPNVTEDTTTTAITTTTGASNTTTQEEQVVLITGGFSNGERVTSTEVYPKTNGCSPPSLPVGRNSPSLFLTAGTNPLVACCGGQTSSGYLNSCLVWVSNDQRWDENMMSPLLQARGGPSAVTIENIGVYAMGGSDLTTSEFLPANSLEWTPGPSLPRGFGSSGCAVAISASSFLYIAGGVIREYEIDIDNPTSSGGWLEQSRWPVLSYRNTEGCARTEKSVLIAGGRNNGYLSSTEVLDIATRQVQIVENLATPRGWHRLATVSTGRMTKTFAIGGRTNGGSSISSVEEWDEDDNNWKQVADMEEARYMFGAVTVPLRLVCPVADP